VLGAVKVNCPVMRLDLSGKWNHSEMEVARHPGAIAKVRGCCVSGKPTSLLSPRQKGKPFLTRLGGGTGEKLLRAILLALLVSKSGSQKLSRVLS